MQAVDHTAGQRCWFSRRDADVEGHVTEVDRPAALEEVKDDVLALDGVRVCAVRHNRTELVVVVAGRHL